MRAPVDTDGRHTRLLGVARLGPTIVAGGVAVGALHGNPRPYLWAGPVGGPLRELNLPREVFGGERIISFADVSAATADAAELGTAGAAGSAGSAGKGNLGAFATGTWDGVTNQSVAQVWRTADGLDWRRLDGVAAMTSTPDEILRGAAVAVGAHRLIVAGAAFDLRHPADRDDGAIWWSDDGVAWSRADLAGAGLTGPGDQELRGAAAVGESPGFLVAGSAGGVTAGGPDAPAVTPRSAAIWWSPDGGKWNSALPLPGGHGSGATVTALATDESGGEWAAGVVGGAARLWRSVDSRHWAAVPLPPAAQPAGGAVQAVALATSADRLLVVTQSSQGSVAAIVAPAAWPRSP